MLITSNQTVQGRGIRRCFFYVPADSSVRLYSVSEETQQAVLTDTVVQNLYEYVDFTGTVDIVITGTAYVDVL